MSEYDPTMHDVCECGCYRFQHWRGTGPCIFNKDDPLAPGLGHSGAPDCQEFRLSLEHDEVFQAHKRGLDALGQVETGDE